MSKTVDNFEIIKQYLEFPDKNCFYHIQVLQRKKDGNDVRVSSGYRRITSFYVFSAEELDDRKDRIVEVCRLNNARAYISVVPNNANEVALECAMRYTKAVLDNDARHTVGVYDSVCGSTRAKGFPRRFVIDVDNLKDLCEIEGILLDIGLPKSGILATVPTVSGAHLITEAFNRILFQKKCTERYIMEPTVQSGNLTLLYCDLR